MPVEDGSNSSKDDRSFPNDNEKLFLNCAYNRWLDLYDEYKSDSFYNKRQKNRYSVLRDMFLVYSEISRYSPIQKYFDYLETVRPKNEAELSRDLFVIIRHLLAHFPFWDTWNEVRFSRDLICWDKKQGKVDRFFEKNEGRDPIKFRVWQPEKKLMTYMQINFPSDYTKNEVCFLKNIVSEKDGMLLVIGIMKQVLDSQIVTD